MIDTPEIIVNRVADAIVSLKEKLAGRRSLNDYFIPIGFDGLVVYHLLCVCIRQNVPGWEDQLQNVLYASSKTGEFDAPKLKGLLEDAKEQRRAVIFLDLQTRTGTLGGMLREAGHAYGSNDATYAVLFDEHRKADIAGKYAAFPEKKAFDWTSREDYEQRIRKIDGRWRYDMSHEAIDGFMHVQAIRRRLERL